MKRRIVCYPGGGAEANHVVFLHSFVKILETNDDIKFYFVAAMVY